MKFIQSCINARRIYKHSATIPMPIVLSSKSTFSQLSKEKMHKVVRICIKIIFHLSKLWKAKFSLLCHVIFLVGLEGKFDIDHPSESKSVFPGKLAKALRYRLKIRKSGTHFTSGYLTFSSAVFLFSKSHWFHKKNRKRKFVFGMTFTGSCGTTPEKSFSAAIKYLPSRCTANRRSRPQGTCLLDSRNTKTPLMYRAGTAGDGKPEKFAPATTFAL